LKEKVADILRICLMKIEEDRNGIIEAYARPDNRRIGNVFPHFVYQWKSTIIDL